MREARAGRTADNSSLLRFFIRKLHGAKKILPGLETAPVGGVMLRVGKARTEVANSRNKYGIDEGGNKIECGKADEEALG